jgi:hypothetical protein
MTRKVQITSTTGARRVRAGAATTINTRASKYECLSLERPSGMSVDRTGHASASEMLSQVSPIFRAA